MFQAPTLTMLEAQVIDTTHLPDGCQFQLVRHGDDWTVRVGGSVLMSSRMYNSEQELAEHALARAPGAQTVLVGGLGLGFTAREVLNRVGPDAKVTVAELVPKLVTWNREHLGQLNDHPLDDPRCEVVVADVFDVIKQSPAKFDVILLDVDNGAIALSQPQNQRLYSWRGVRACYDALTPQGVFALWSAAPSPRFERRLADAGFAVEVLRVSARKGSHAKHVVFLAQASRERSKRPA
jgi:spermidine synthase